MRAGKIQKINIECRLEWCDRALTITFQGTTHPAFFKLHIAMHRPNLSICSFRTSTCSLPLFIVAFWGELAGILRTPPLINTANAVFTRMVKTENNFHLLVFATLNFCFDPINQISIRYEKVFIVKTIFYKIWSPGQTGSGCFHDSCLLSGSSSLPSSACCQSA